MSRCRNCGILIELDDFYGDWFAPGVSWPEDMSCGGHMDVPHAPEEEEA